MDLYLFGDITDAFAATSRAFATAAAARDGDSVALLFQGGPGWEAYVARYRDAWRDLVELVVVVPEPDLTLSHESRRVIERSAGVFIGGGDTARYHEIYVDGAVGGTLRDLGAAGVPFGGVSAGAMLTGDVTLVGDHPGDYVEGLGCLANSIVEAHFSELARLDRLVTALDRTAAGIGIGLDEATALHVRDGTYAVLGEASAHLIELAPTGEMRRRMIGPGMTVTVT